MRLDFDTRLSLAFLFGMVGLIEQGAIQVLAGIEPSAALSGGFVSLMVSTIGVGLLRGSRDAHDPDDEGAVSQERRDRHDHLSKREGRRGR